MAVTRYFRHRTLRTWYAGVLKVESDTFSDDGLDDADRIATACGFSVGSLEPVTLNAADADPRTGTLFSEPVVPTPPLDTDGQRIYDYMPVSGSATAAAVSAYIGNTSNDPAIRATMVTLRSLIRKSWRERNVQ